MKKKYLLALISLIPALLLAYWPLFKMGWPLIGISSVSVIFLGIYVFNNNFRLIMESNQGSNMFIAWLDCFLMMGVVIASYTMTILFIMELTFKYDLNSRVMFIFCLFLAIPVFKSWRRIVINFIKTT